MAWKTFRNYHYLDHNFNYTARAFVGYVNGDIACFCGVLPQPGLFSNLFRISRIVVLPDFQGLGLGDRLNIYLGELYWRSNKRLSIVTTHPGLIKSYSKSDKWKLVNFDKSVKVDGNFDNNKLSNRLKASFIYIPKDYDVNNIWDLN